MILCTIFAFANLLHCFEIKWKKQLSPFYDRMTYGASAAIADLGTDVNSVGGEPNSFLEIVLGSDEYNIWSPELGDTVVGIWRCFDAHGNLEWVVDTKTDESRSSPAIFDFYSDLAHYPELIAGTTSGWNVEALDRHGNFLWTFPSPPIRYGTYMWHSSPAIADLITDLAGYEVVIGNNPCGGVFCFQAQPTDSVDDGMSFSIEENLDCFAGYSGTSGGIDGRDYDVLWVFSPSTVGPVISSPTVCDFDGDGQLEVLFGDGYYVTYAPEVSSSGSGIYCLSANDGTLEWFLPVGDGSEIISASCATCDFDGDGDMELVVGASDANIYVIDGDENLNGSIDAEEYAIFPMRGAVFASCVIADFDADSLYEFVAADMTGNVMCVEYVPPSTLNVLWHTELDTAIIGSPAVCSTVRDPMPWAIFCGNVRRINFYPNKGEVLKIIITSLGGYLYRLDGASGNIEESTRFHKNIHTSPIVADIDLDCELEAIFTGSDGLGLSYIPDTIFCVGTGIFLDSCGSCGEIFAQPICPIATDTVITSCMTQGAYFALFDTSFFDSPDTFWTYATVCAHNNGDELRFALFGGSSRMHFSYKSFDSLEVEIFHNWRHADTVTVTLDSSRTRLGCVSRFDSSISFIVDLRAPEIRFAPEAGIVEAGVLNFDAQLFDDIAGIDSSSIMCYVEKTMHGSVIETLFFGSNINGSIELNAGERAEIFVHVCDATGIFACTCAQNCTTVSVFYTAMIPAPRFVFGLSCGTFVPLIFDDIGIIDSTSLRIAVQDSIIEHNSPLLILSGDTIEIFPPLGFWREGSETICVLNVADTLGGELAEPYCVAQKFDFSPPRITTFSPLPTEPIFETYPQISFTAHDSLSSVDASASFCEIGGRMLSFDELGTADSHIVSLSFETSIFGVAFSAGETLRVHITLCDTQEFCPSLCCDTTFEICMAPTFGCACVPNPFTPNADAKNDIAKFEFPNLAIESARISIFDVHGVRVRRIVVPTGAAAKACAIWDGCDDTQRLLTEGVYLFIIEQHGEIICSGTITLAH